MRERGRVTLLSPSVRFFVPPPPPPLTHSLASSNGRSQISPETAEEGEENERPYTGSPTPIARLRLFDRPPRKRSSDADAETESAARRGEREGGVKYDDDETRGIKSRGSFYG